MNHHLLPLTGPPSPKDADVNRRAAKDRRRRPTPMFSRYFWFGRRRAGRRDGENRDVYVDRYHIRELFLLGSLLALCLIDALWTLKHLTHGVREANPLMAWVLAQFGPVGFVTVKVGVTALAVAFLLFHVRFRCTRALLPVTHVVYTCLLFIHIATEMVT